MFAKTNMLSAQKKSVYTPDELYGDLFTNVQMQRVFPDNKTFVDAIPLFNPEEILRVYELERKQRDFSLEDFVHRHFAIPEPYDTNYYSDTNTTITQHLEKLWKVLRREPDQDVLGSSLLPLPYPYIVPGGRFNEIYYWDSYFTMLGLQVSGEFDMVENMVKNFAFMIDRYGLIPNGNRSYFLSRSQPPYFSLMVELLADSKGEQVYIDYLQPLIKEYNFWMDKTAKSKHTVQMPDGALLNRFYDQFNTPRQESFYEDIKHNEISPKKDTQLYRDLRSGAESGWDYSSRWFADGMDIHTIETTRLIPVDLNCLMFHLEQTISRGYKLTGNKVKANKYRLIARRRKAAINHYLFNKKDGWYYDYNIRTDSLSREKTLAALTPFFLNIAPEKHIKKVAETLKREFLKSGGVVTTLRTSGEQWDSPNGWAPLHWITIVGLQNYGQDKLAENIARRWIALNTKVYYNTGKMMEKYNVIDANLEAGGGEYPAQDGFGWSNGVLLKLIDMYGEF